MNDERETERRLEGWLKQDAPRIPPSLLEEVGQAVSRTAQVRRRPMFRHRSWDRPLFRLALAVSALVGVLLVGPPSFEALRSILPWPPAAQPGASLPTSGPPASALPSASGDPFTGAWSALDVDGSALTVSFSGEGPTRSVVIDDGRATACGGGRDVVEGDGSILGAAIHVVGRDRCEGRTTDRAFDLTLTYDPAAGTLTSPVFLATGGGSLTWSRGVSATDAFSGTWIASDPRGGSMSLILAGTGLNRSVRVLGGWFAACGGAATLDAQGSGTIGAVSGDGPYLRATLRGACAGSGASVEVVAKWRFDYATGTLVGPLQPADIGGSPVPETVTWHRP